MMVINYWVQGVRLKKALKKINSSFFVVYGDSFIRCNLNNIYKNFVKK